MRINALKHEYKKEWELARQKYQDNFEEICALYGVDPRPEKSQKIGHTKKK